MLEDLQAFRQAESKSVQPTADVKLPDSPPSKHALLAKVRNAEEEAAYLRTCLEKANKELTTMQTELVSVYDN